MGFGSCLVGLAGLIGDFIDSILKMGKADICRVLRRVGHSGRCYNRDLYRCIYIFKFAVASPVIPSPRTQIQS